jgi:hypothetical protein
VSHSPELEKLYRANNTVRVSVPTKVQIYSGLPHGFRRWTRLHAAQAFDSDIVNSINALVTTPEVSHEWDSPWTIYSGKSQEEHKDRH